MDETLQRIIESKAKLRRTLARKSIAEKLRIVEQLAERARVIRKGRSAKA